MSGSRGKTPHFLELMQMDWIGIRVWLQCHLFHRAKLMKLMKDDQNPTWFLVNKSLPKVQTSSS